MSLFTVDNELVCQNLDSFFSEYKQLLNSMKYKAMGPLGELGDNLYGAVSDVIRGVINPADDIQDTVVGGVNSLVNEVLTVATDVNSLIQCLGPDMFRMIGFDPNAFYTSGTACPQYAKSMLNSITSVVTNYISSLVSSVLTIPEQAVLGSMNKVEQSVPYQKLNRALKVINCMNNCGSSGNIITEEDINQAFQESGMTPVKDGYGVYVGGTVNIDMSSLALSSDDRDEIVEHIRQDKNDPFYNPTEQEIQDYFNSYKNEAKNRMESIQNLQRDALLKSNDAVKKSIESDINTVRKCSNNSSINHIYDVSVKSVDNGIEYTYPVGEI